MAEPTLTYGPKIWTTTKMYEARIETTVMKLLRSAAGYTGKEQKSRNELNISNINNNNSEIHISVEISRSTNGRQTNSKDNSYTQLKRRRNTGRMKGIGWNRPSIT
jgi:hypothetical protein